MVALKPMVRAPTLSNGISSDFASHATIFPAKKWVSCLQVAPIFSSDQVRTEKDVLMREKNRSQSDAERR